MSTNHGNGSHYDSHRQAAELHDKAAHTHRAASATHGQQDHQSGHEQTKQALEHSHQAFLRSQEAHRMDSKAHSKVFGHGDIAALAHEIWVGNGCPEGSAEQDWIHAREQLGSKQRP